MTPAAEMLFGCLGAALCLGAAAVVIALGELLGELLRWWVDRGAAPRFRRFR